VGKAEFVAACAVVMTLPEGSVAGIDNLIACARCRAGASPTKSRTTAEQNDNNRIRRVVIAHLRIELMVGSLVTRNMAFVTRKTDKLAALLYGLFINVK
jgi:hypothetical protein